MGIYQVFPETLAKRIEIKLLDKFEYNTKVPILEFNKYNDKDLNFLADYVYQKIFVNYTAKQWGEVSDEIYESIRNFVIQTANDKEVIYNLFSLVTMPIFHGFETYKQYTCIGFVNEVLVKTGKIKFYKPTYKYTPKELEKILKPYLFLDGYISNGTDGLEDDYFKPVGIRSSLIIDILFMYECFYRLIRKKPSKRYINWYRIKFNFKIV